MRLRVLLLALVSAASLAPAIGAAEGTEVEVGMSAGAFAQPVVRVEAGDLVVWRNTDGRSHTVTSAWDDGATFHRVLKPGETFAVRFEAAGEYRIRCVPHSMADGHGGHEGMVATVQVSGAAAAQDSSGGVSSKALLVPLAAALLAFVAFKLRGGVPLPGARRRPTRQ